VSAGFSGDTLAADPPDWSLFGRVDLFWNAAA